MAASSNFLIRTSRDTRVMPERFLASVLPQHEAAELYRLMVIGIRDVAVFVMDPDGVITVWNRAAEIMKGYSADEAIGQHLRMLYTDADRAIGWAEHNLAKAAEDGVYSEERWRQRKDGSQFWAHIVLTIADMNATISFIEALSARGCRFSLDDFGTGMTSFSYLKQLPVDFIKIDGSLIQTMASSEMDVEMVRFTNDISHKMGRQTIAEYVSDPGILASRRAIGVDYAQGYWVGKPRPLTM